MNPALSEEQYDPQRLRELFTAACELDDPARARFIDENCTGSPGLRKALEKLLGADRDATSRTLWNFPALHAEARHQAAEGILPLSQLGPYRILSRIGTGGMGAVYLAERDYDDVRRQVAIKVIPWAMVDEDTLRRFRQERQILARMEHPNIARMLDAGRTPDGMPYLVMEYVDGIPIDRYAAVNSLSMRARLDLFQAVCDAVAFAHRNLIVHRDLKPRNILVTAEGVPKLLDFGIAKLLSEASDPEATSTALMTPAYASPEQLAGNPITTASDIYTLGIILYELASGSKFATPRQRLAADLENVVAMALRSEPERRYASAGDLAEDARRAVEGYPVRARPDSLAYRAGRLAARRPVEAAAAMLMTIALIAALVVAYRQYSAARQRFNEVRSVANSFLFDVYDALGDLPGTTPARRLVAERAQQYLDTLASDRSSDLALRKELAASYVKLGDILGRPWAANLGDTAGALANYRKANAVFAMIDASGHGDARLFQDWGMLYSRELRLALRRGLPDDAVTAGEKSVALLDRAVALGPVSRDVALAAVDSRVYLCAARLEVANAHGGLSRYQRAQSEAEGALDRARKLAASNPGDDQLALEPAKAGQYLGYITHDMGWYTGDNNYYLRVLRLTQEVVAILRRIYANHPDRYRRQMADSLLDLSRIESILGDGDEGEQRGRESLKLFEEIAATDPRNVEAAGDLVIVHWTLAQAFAASHRTMQAKAEYEKALESHERIKQQIPYEEGDNKLIVESRDWLAGERLATGDYAGAISLYRANVDLLAGSKKVKDQVDLALDYGLMGDATAPVDQTKAVAFYKQAAELWENLRDSGQLPPRFAGKPGEMQSASLRSGLISPVN
ncbi:MAG TPA: serine/threonine-protein kinase [Bryobacteraceae bacterium]|nr:serine/threonine-protein kinase [Bryobacteraceae bacterium]